MAKKEECCKDANPFVAITAVTGGIMLVVVVLFLILAKEMVALLIPMLWAFVVLGVVAAGFAYKSNQK